MGVSCKCSLKPIHWYRSFLPFFLDGSPFWRAKSCHVSRLCWSISCAALCWHVSISKARWGVPNGAPMESGWSSLSGISHGKWHGEVVNTVSQLDCIDSWTCKAMILFQCTPNNVVTKSNNKPSPKSHVRYKYMFNILVHQSRSVWEQLVMIFLEPTFPKTNIMNTRRKNYGKNTKYRNTRE